VRHPARHGHVERVAAYAHEIALELGWKERLLEQLRFGATLHDIGKIIIREHTLFKPGSLDPQEWEAMRKHPLTGSEMVKNIPHLAPAMAIIRHHHERWDGQGYPDGLAGSQIPQGARIVAVADGFDTMTSPSLISLPWHCKKPWTSLRVAPEVSSIPRWWKPSCAPGTSPKSR